VLVGEMRDLETVAIAIETAETGPPRVRHLHTSSAPSTVDRIIDQFPRTGRADPRDARREPEGRDQPDCCARRSAAGACPVLEMLIATPSVANLIREAKIFQIPSIMQTGKKYGMCLMNEGSPISSSARSWTRKRRYAKAMDKPGSSTCSRKNAIDTSWAPVRRYRSAPASAELGAAL
jgi:twitching motility protein PilT